MLRKLASVNRKLEVNFYCGDNWLKRIKAEGLPSEMFVYKDENYEGEEIDLTDNGGSCQDDKDKTAYVLARNGRIPDRVIFCEEWLGELIEDEQLDKLFDEKTNRPKKIDDAVQLGDVDKERMLAIIVAHELQHTDAFGRRMKPCVYLHLAGFQINFANCHITGSDISVQTEDKDGKEIIKNAYGPDLCRELALQNPDAAVLNPDSIVYFVLGQYLSHNPNPLLQIRRYYVNQILACHLNKR